MFPVRGQPDQDREYRHPRVRADKTRKRDVAKARREVLDAPVPLRAVRLIVDVTARISLLIGGYRDDGIAYDVVLCMQNELRIHNKCAIAAV